MIKEMQYLTRNEDEMTEFVLEPQLHIAAASKVVVQ